MSKTPAGIVFFASFVTAETATGPIVVPWQAQPIIAMAEINPPSPPVKKLSPLKNPGCTFGTPNVTNIRIEPISTTVMILLSTEINLDPRILAAKNNVMITTARSFVCGIMPGKMMLAYLIIATLYIAIDNPLTNVIYALIPVNTGVNVIAFWL